MFVFGLSVFFFGEMKNLTIAKFFFSLQTTEMVLEKPQNSSVFCTLRTKREREREREERDEHLYLSAFL